MDKLVRDYVIPDWPCPENIQACATTRSGGVSKPPFDSFNLADHVGDDLEAVRQNRELLKTDLHLPADPVWLTQVHGNDVLTLPAEQSSPLQADVSMSFDKDVVCAVLTADCLPLLFCDIHGQGVAAAHAGWRGLAAGVIEATVEKYLQQASDVKASDMLVWLGPSIGPNAFEVGAEVLQAFAARYSAADKAFRQTGTANWLADLYQLARIALGECGVTHVYGANYCSWTEARFYSYRRDRQTGRMASLIWKK